MASFSPFLTQGKSSIKLVYFYAHFLLCLAPQLPYHLFHVWFNTLACARVSGRMLLAIAHLASKITGCFGDIQTELYSDLILPPSRMSAMSTNERRQAATTHVACRVRIHSNHRLQANPQIGSGGPDTFGLIELISYTSWSVPT